MKTVCWRSSIWISILAMFLVGACHDGDESIRSGLWRGSITIQGREVAVDLEIVGDEVFFSVPVQAIYKVPARHVSLRRDRFAFRVPLGKIAVRFSGAAGADGNTITGSFLQGTMQGSFIFEYANQIEYANQAESREVDGGPGKDADVHITRDGFDLFGSLRRLSSGDDRGEWAAMIIAGSGPTDGDGNSLLYAGKNNSLLRLAGYLAEEGIPTLRFDKRGAGRSRADDHQEEDLRFQDLIGDAEAWYGLLQDEYPDRRYILFGHSQGSLIALDIAARHDVDGVVSLAGAGFPVAETLATQLEEFPPELRDTGMRILSELSAGRRIREIPESLQLLFRPSVQPFLISYMAYDPAEIIGRVDCPVLIVQGGMDSQVGIEEGERLRDADGTKVAGGDVRYLYLPRMNHLLRDVSDTVEDQRTYGEDRLPLSIGLKDGIREFLAVLSADRIIEN